MPRKSMAGPKKPRGRPPGSRNKPKTVATWQDRLALGPVETIRASETTTTGTLGQRDVERYDVVDGSGQNVGTVVYAVSTSLKPPFQASHWLVQKDAAGSVIVDRRW